MTDEDRRRHVYMTQSLRAELSDAVFQDAIPDLGNPNTGFTQHQIAEWIVDSNWLTTQLAKAWTEGNDTGYSDGYSGVEPDRQKPNPYRVDQKEADNGG